MLHVSRNMPKTSGMIAQSYYPDISLTSPSSTPFSLGPSANKGGAAGTILTSFVCDLGLNPLPDIGLQLGKACYPCSGLG